MTELWAHVLRELPGLAVLVWLVYYFLKHMRALNRDNHDRYHEGMETLTKSCGTHQERVGRSVDRNSDCLDELNKQLHKINGG